MSDETLDIMAAFGLAYALVTLVWAAASKVRGGLTWTGEPTPRIRPLAGGVIQRRPDEDHKTYVIPCTGRKCELDPEDGTVARIIDPVYRPMWVTQGDTDAAIIDCITKLWRPEEVA